MTEEKQVSLVESINREINSQLSNEAVSKALLATTFNGLDATNMKKAIMEGMIRGFNFKDFLEKNVYAIPYSKGYSLITSIDFNRKKGMKGGIVGKDKPVYVVNEKTGKIISCEVSVYKNINGYIGKFTAEVFFDEYYKAGKNGYPSLWDSKPRTMIAKVAEMHALRMACPEELSQSYIEEEMEKEIPVIDGRLEEAKKEAETITMGSLKKDADQNQENKDEVQTTEGN